MAISQFQFSVCIDCSDNLYTITDDSSGTVTAPIGAESVKVTYPNDDSVTFDLYSNTQDSLFGHTMGISALGCTSASLSFAPVLISGTNYYHWYITYTNTSGVLTVQSFYFDSTSSSFSVVGGLIVDAINAQTSTTGVSASYNSSTRRVDLTGASFGLSVIANGNSNMLVHNVNAELTTDGKYIITWELDDADLSPSKHISTIESYFLCNVECCVRGKMSAIDVDCDCTGDKATDAAVNAMLMLQGIKAAAACGKDAKADKLLEGLQAICNNDCKSC